MRTQGDYLAGARRSAGPGDRALSTALPKGVTFLECRTFGIAAHWLERA
jgi:hypothetical protein